MGVVSTVRFSESVDARLTATVFNQSGVLIVGGLVPASVAMLGFARTGQHWFIGWAVASAVVLVYRLAVDAAFGRRRLQVGRPTVWRNRFLIGTWVNGANCGIGAAASVLLCDPFTQLLSTTMVTAFVMGSAARNGTFPRAALGSILLAEMPLLVVCLGTRDPYYICFSIFIVLFIGTAASVAKHIYRQTARLFVADEENAALVREVGRSNRELGTANENFVRANEQLEKANIQLAAMARIDGLTGLPNRRAFDEHLDRETRAAVRENTLLSLMMFDVDFFKKYNDYYGHQRGDECLQLIARTLASCVPRRRDIVARYGGEEFVAILPQTDPRNAAALAETMRAAVSRLELEHAASAAGRVTVSIGVATSLPGEPEAAGDILRRADQALYVAKSSGRNRVCSALGASTPTAA